jgi:hypothetical protein
MKLILDKLLKHAETAARIVGGIDGVTVGPLTAAIDLIVRELHGLAKLLASPERTALVKLLAHAASAARIVGHSDALAACPLAEHVDAIVHELSELLGNPHLIAAPVPIARPMFALDVTPDAVPEHVAPDAPAASRTISIAVALSGGAR